MLGALAVRRRYMQAKDEARHNQSGTSDQEGERIGTARRKRRRRECHHDPWARELAKTIMGCYYWLLEPYSIKEDLGNGLEGTSWSIFCSSSKMILLGMVLFRVINFFMIQTFYVPDEYWQSLEVAHHQTFGYGYLTWEWTAKIRSFLYPSIFTLLYKLLDLTGFCSHSFLTKLPRLLQALFYAVGDLYLYRLSSKISSPLVAQWTLLCNCLSWFIFYCSTRTLANTAETTLFIIALYYYPWDDLTKPSLNKSTKSSWKFLWIVAVTVMIRPTAVILWLPLCTCHIWYMRQQLWKVFVLYITTGSVFLFMMMRIDKAIYGEWTIVPLNFFYFNVSKKISHIYGTHPWYWYFTQCLPFVLSAHLVLLTLGWKRCKNRTLQTIIIWTIVVYSWQPHKEFRFILPILPLCMHVCGYYITTLHQEFVIQEKQKLKQLETITEEQVSKYLKDFKEKEAKKPDQSADNDSGLTSSDLSDSLSETEIMKSVRRKLNKVNKNGSKYQLLTPRRAVVLLVVGNLPMMLYFGLIHQRGSLDVIQYLNSESSNNQNMSVLFLMPCHSTPYYSHIHSNITMRFLTCEPNLSGADNYTDEADMFYQDPVRWLKSEVVKGPNKHVYSHVVMFDRLERYVEGFLSKGKYFPTANFFYSHITDSERRSKLIKLFTRQASNVATSHW